MPIFIENIDLSILRAVDSLSLPFLNVIAQAFSLLCEHGLFPIILSLVLLIPKKTRRIGVTMIIAFALSFLVTNLLIKPLVARPRPYVKYDFRTDALLPHDLSFPSGHASFAFAAAFAFFFAGRKQFKKWAIVAVVLAFCIGLSRIWLKVHYPSDVVAGAVIGALCGLLSSIISAAIFRKFAKAEVSQ